MNRVIDYIQQRQALIEQLKEKRTASDLELLNWFDCVLWDIRQLIELVEMERVFIPDPEEVDNASIS